MTSLLPASILSKATRVTDNNNNNNKVLSFYDAYWNKGSFSHHRDCTDQTPPARDGTVPNIEGTNIPIGGTVGDFQTMNTHDVFSSSLPQILIREEFKLCHQHVIEFNRSRPTSTAFIICGHPGIGKTCFLIYLLAHRLLAKQETFLQLADTFVYHFGPTGVHEFDLTSKDARLLKNSPPGMWVLVDSNVEVPRPHGLFINAGSEFFLVHSTSPRKDHYAYKKQLAAGSDFFFMKPWSWEEIVQGRRLNLILPATEKQLLTFFVLFGPVARDCYQYANNIEDYMKQVQDALLDFRTPNSKQITDFASVLNLQEVVRHLFVVHPLSPDRSWAIIQPLSPYIFDLLVEQDKAYHQQTIFNMIDHCLHVSDAAVFARKMWQRAMDRTLRLGGLVSTQPMKATGSGHKRLLYQLDSSGQSLQYDFPPSQVQHFWASSDLHLQKNLKENVYYKPFKVNQPTFDSFLIYNNKLVAFQATTTTGADKHDLNDKVLQELEAIRKLAGCEKGIRYVIVSPSSSYYESSAITIEVSAAMARQIDLMVEGWFIPCKTLVQRSGDLIEDWDYVLEQSAWEEEEEEEEDDGRVAPIDR